MKAPAFQFYVKDWLTDANLRRCSPAARGVWIDVLCLLHDSEEYGVLRWPLRDIAQSAGASMAHVRELVAKEVLRGADANAEPYVWAPTHAGKTGDPVVLVQPGEGPCWYSRRFVKDEYVRQRRGAGTRFDGDNQPQKDARPPAAPGTERARLRATVFDKTDGHCAHCKRVLDGDWHIDHFIPRAKGGSNLLANLVPSCVPCNQDKADSMPDDWQPNNTPTRRVGGRHGDGASTASASASNNEPSGDSAPSAAGGERTGYFEGHPEPVTTPNPVAAYAIALSRAGFQCTSLNPDLVAYVQAGGTVDHLLQCAALEDCRGKKAGYPIRIALRELTEPAKPVAAGAPKALSKTAQAFLTLEGMKSANRLDSGRSAAGAAEVAGLVAGPHPGKRTAADHGGDVG